MLHMTAGYIRITWPWPTNGEQIQIRKTLCFVYIIFSIQKNNPKSSPKSWLDTFGRNNLKFKYLKPVVNTTECLSPKSWNLMKCPGPEPGDGLSKPFFTGAETFPNCQINVPLSTDWSLLEDFLTVLGHYLYSVIFKIYSSSLLDNQMFA